MMYTIRVSDGVDKVIAKWKKSNPNLFKKYKKIYKELLEHPKTGLGHPEALRGGVSPYCSLVSCAIFGRMQPKTGTTTSSMPRRSR